ncbi:MAG: hypothetical protein DMG17_28585 [Acidobacteria bacterium]|nr:MAG: hypothetical protein DMG17_28585 [Acidobacteriota bacterium]
MALIIGINGVECADCFVILDHYWFAARQVADGPITDPSILKLHVRGLGAAELAARTLDVLLVKFRCSRDLAGSPDAPAAFLQFGLILQDNALFTGNVRNELILSFQKERQNMGSPATAPAVIVKEAFTGGPSQSTGRETKTIFDINDTVTRLGVTHSFIFGSRFRTARIDAVDASNFGGTFEFSSLPLFAAGMPYVFRVSQGDPSVVFAVRETSGFVQDDVHVREGLNLTFGLRYSWQSTTDDRNNLAPRFAFAFSPGPKRKTVLRGGAGIFYDDLPRAARRRSLLLDGFVI